MVLHVPAGTCIAAKVFGTCFWNSSQIQSTVSNLFQKQTSKEVSGTCVQCMQAFIYNIYTTHMHVIQGQPSWWAFPGAFLPAGV